MKQMSICLTDAAFDKFEELAEYYCLPIDMLIQKALIDRVDEQYEAVIISAKKAKEQL